jgi:hypothetical protein
VIAEELLIQLDSIFDFFVFYYFLELLLEIREKANSTWLVIDFFIIIISL